VLNGVIILLHCSIASEFEPAIIVDLMRQS
jgi:hypothetical protein